MPQSSAAGNVGCRDFLCHGSGHGIRDRGRDSVGAFKKSRKPSSGSVESFLLGEPWGRATTNRDGDNKLVQLHRVADSTGPGESHGPVTGVATAPYGQTFVIDNHWTAGHALADTH